ncbi:A24 family peptidase [Amycolatopsis sp. NPDC006131]|uniref:A24 family peptidase n=1 Tax=Amycolatopsis sp. NPDC006131 TaxID=3156731 RepID=UPI00339E250C
MNPLVLTGWAAAGAGLALGLRVLPPAWALGAREWVASAVLTAALFAAVGWRFGWGIDLVAYSTFSLVVVPLALLDFVEQRLPSVLILAGLLALGTIFGLGAVLAAGYADFLRAVAGMAVLGLAYLVLALAVGGLGAGDVKLAGLLGLALGWQSWTAIMLGTVAGWLLAAVARLVLRATGRMSRDAPMPLGPYLALGALVTILGGLAH